MMVKKIEIEPFTFRGESKEEKERFKHYLLGKAIFESLEKEDDI